MGKMVKIKILFSITFVLIFEVVHSQALSDDTLHWTEHRKISWNDFKGDTIDIPGMAGQTMMLILANFNKIHAFFPATTKVVTVFDRKNSWTKNTTKDNLTLKYYQTEFNLYEVYARKLRQDFSKTKFGMDPNTIFQQKYNANLTALSDRTKLLMKETKLGTDSVAIEKWDKKISEELIELEAFKNKK